MRILDLFCGAGGAAWGYHLAWPDAEIVGVDIEPQPRYPFTFVQADALSFPLDGFEFVHASPPCQAHSSLAALHGDRNGTGWMLAATIDRLEQAGVPWIVENVEGARVDRPSTIVCGSSFGLKVRRHRRFYSSVPLTAPACRHAEQGRPVGVYGHTGGRSTRDPVDTRHTLAGWCEAMGIDWMTARELAQAIPPAYTKYIGEEFKRGRAAD